ncbi:hypothetical protein MW887_007897 [Aspergillus wentii]|nr:hypothetical protein MW887_007897 [Aspergillus wentii]
MSEKQNRKVSLISSLQILGRNTFGTRHNRQLCEEENTSKSADWNNNHKAGRIFSLGPPFQSTGRQPPPFGGFLSFQGKKATHPYRHVSLPVSVQGYSLGVSGIDGGIKSKEALEEKTKMRIRRLNPKLQQSASNAEALKSPTYLPAQTSKGSSKPAYSRIPTPSHAKKLPFRKVRTRSNSLHQQPFPYGQLTEAQSCTNKENIAFQPGGEMNSNRNRWSNYSENLRNIEKARLGIHAVEPEEPVERHIPSEFERGRQKDQAERMVPRASSASTRILCARQKLTTHPGGTCQVSESQPRQYWLGRFMTLTNAFHYEDSFNEPDISTGFGMLSSYSRPLKQPDTDLSSYHIKRAFMVLENVCTTEQASASLRNFREEYIALHGSRWMK